MDEVDFFLIFSNYIFFLKRNTSRLVVNNPYFISILYKFKSLSQAPRGFGAPCRGIPVFLAPSNIIA